MKYVMIAVVAVAGLAGCATVQGAGKDMQSAGRAVETRPSNSGAAAHRPAVAPLRAPSSGNPAT